MSELDRWQREDGWPRGDYFRTVVALLSEGRSGGLPVAAWWRDDDMSFSCDLADDAFAVGSYSGYERVYLRWCVNDDYDAEHDGGRPTGPDDFLGHGWYLLPFSDAQAESGDDFHYLGLPYLAEPEAVAAAVKSLIA